MNDETSRIYENTFFSKANSKFFFFPKKAHIILIITSFSCRCKSQEYFVSKTHYKETFQLYVCDVGGYTPWRERSPKNRCHCWLQHNPPTPLPLGQTQGIWRSLVLGESVIWPLPGWCGKFKQAMSSLTFLDYPGLTGWFDRCHLSHSSLCSWQNCFCACEFDSNSTFSWLCHGKRAPSLSRRNSFLKRTARSART